MSRKNRIPARRSGFTLIEMIVVVVVVLTVSGLAIAIAAPDNEARRLRETARQVSSMLQNARAKAIEIGRPVGVSIEPDEINPLRATSLQYVEVAPPYGGDFADSKAIVGADPSFPTDITRGIAQVGAADAMWQGLVKIGDLIRFNHQGHFYQIVGPVDPTDNTLVDRSAAAFEIRSINSAVPRFADQGLSVPYEVVRQPETSAGPPLEIPDGVVIDLSLSGVGKAGTFPADPGPINLIFSPKGQVAILMPEDPTGTFQRQAVPFDAIFLMIGNNESIGAITAGTDNNLNNPNAYWVTVHHQTGLVTSSDNVPNSAGNLPAARGKSIQSESTTTN
ncbi:MAG: prepilin-type N-terminal cleavage/methylation domain-containing protein [Pirellulales bacterium]|nr:prepilin-type N-terminal cleavage/methylation domain-containing protein [Pirellulales bacterium]